MKTLSKLRINPEKVLENNELRQLKGGWDGYCWVYNVVKQVMFQGPASGSSQQQVAEDCDDFYNPYQLYCECY